MKILLSGASGFIGKPLSDFFLSQGHSVIRLSREKSSPDSIWWDPEQGRAVPDEFEGFDAVVHLAGEPLTVSRWSRRKKEKILFSRTVGTYFLSQILSHLITPPKVFFSASAVGYYGDRGDEILTEESGPGRGFLANVCCEWEKASFVLEDRGIRRVFGRFGPVLGPNGGLLKKMAIPFKLGLGGPLGSGKQWFSWIDRQDLIRAIGHILSHPSLNGPINLVSPNPVTQREFAKTLAKRLHRPASFSLPEWLLKLIYGQSAEEMILSSARAEPKKLLADGFVFEFPDLSDSLQKISI